MKRSEFISMARSNLYLACLVAASLGVPLAQAQLWAKSL